MKRLLLLLIIGFAAVACKDPDLSKIVITPYIDLEDYSDPYATEYDFSAIGGFATLSYEIRRPTLGDITFTTNCDWVNVSKIEGTNLVEIAVEPNITKGGRSGYIIAKHGGATEMFRISQQGQVTDIIKKDYCLWEFDQDSGNYRVVFGNFEYRDNEYYYLNNNSYIECTLNSDSLGAGQIPQGSYSPIKGVSYSCIDGVLSNYKSLSCSIFHFDSTATYLGYEVSGKSYIVYNK
ncbi:MAG: BACON domain-containing protein [Alistipes sp.]|nr:BACON domain-containing protein [Alistipes sp.]